MGKIDVERLEKIFEKANNRWDVGWMGNLASFS